MTRKQPLAALIFLPAACALAGCGGGQPAPGSAEDAVAKVAQSMPDRTGNAKAFRESFVEGAAPADSERSRYSKYQIKAAKSSVTGETASVEVHFYDDNAGKEVGTATWTFVKQGDKWKLKTAPLP